MSTVTIKSANPDTAMQTKRRSAVSALAMVLTAVFFLPSLSAIIEHAQPASADLFITLTLSVWLLSALVCGSSIISPEVGSGSLQLLNSLPISRKRIWRIKIGMGAVVLAGCAAASALTMTLLCLFGSTVHCVRLAVSDPSGTDNLILAALGATVPLYAIGAAATMMTDRTITALMAALVAAVLILSFNDWSANEVLPILYNNSAGNYQNHCLIDLESAFAALSTLVCFHMSYRLFTQGETLKTRKRFIILAGYLLPPACLLGALGLGWLIIVS